MNATLSTKIETDQAAAFAPASPDDKRVKAAKKAMKKAMNKYSGNDEHEQDYKNAVQAVRDADKMCTAKKKTTTTKPKDLCN